MSGRWYSSQTQIATVCEALLKGAKLTHSDTIAMVKAHRLAAIIHKLKEDYDWPIEAVYRGPEHERVYWLKAGTEPHRLTFPRSAKALAEEYGGK